MKDLNKKCFIECLRLFQDLNKYIKDLDIDRYVDLVVKGVKR